VIAVDNNGNHKLNYALSSLPNAFFQLHTGRVRDEEKCFLITGMNKVYLVNNKFPSQGGFPIKGNTPLGISSITGKKMLLVTADEEGMLYYYEIK
jgi:hypothetical protein